MAIKIWRTAAVVTGSPGLRGSAVNVFHFQTDDTTVRCQAAVDAIRDWYSAMQAYYNNASSVSIGDRVVAFDPANPHLPGAVAATVPRVVAGTGGTGALPAQVSLVASWRTGLSGKSFRGRTYLGPLISTPYDAGTGEYKPANITALQGFANTFVAAMNALTDTSYLLYSPTIGGTQLINNCVVSAVPATQRGRIR